MMRRSAYERAGGYRPMFYFAQDIDLWSRMVEFGSHLVVPEVLYEASLSPGSISGSRRREQEAFHALIVAATRARRLLILTDVVGVLDAGGVLIPELSVSEARKLIDNGTIAGGMIPKIETCIDAVEQGVGGAVIIDGRVPHAILLELFTEHGAGTLITPDE